LFAAVATESGVQDCTGTLLVVTGDGQVTVVQLLLLDADAGEQLATGTLLVLLFEQVVAV
jgi:hypothetical protein